MESFLYVLRQPWPWYVAGPLIGLTVPLLIWLGNKLFGISSSLRHICAACIPGNISFFNYDWKLERWSLFLVTGIVLGGFLATTFLSESNNVDVNERLAQELSTYGITDFSNQVPAQLFNFSTLFTLKGFLLIVVGGFLVGFGTRYAGGCTSGHSITGISTLQLASLIATICFMIGGIVTANFVLPFILKL